MGQFFMFPIFRDRLKDKVEDFAGAQGFEPLPKDPTAKVEVKVQNSILNTKRLFPQI
jgi:hypothetical protein